MDVHHPLHSDSRYFWGGPSELHRREPADEAVDPAGFRIRRKLGLASGTLPQ